MSDEIPEMPEVAQFKRLSLPLIRRVYPQLIHDKFCGVQPLSGPSTLPYYLRASLNRIQGINNDGWIIKPKKKKIWRDITEPWEPSNDV